MKEITYEEVKALIAVAQGSEHQPVFAVLIRNTYNNKVSIYMETLTPAMIPSHSALYHNTEQGEWSEWGIPFNDLIDLLYGLERDYGDGLVDGPDNFHSRAIKLFLLEEDYVTNK